jgi:hypothetical protein
MCGDVTWFMCAKSPHIKQNTVHNDKGDDLTIYYFRLSSLGSFGARD